MVHGYLGAHIAYEFLKENKGDLYCLIRAKNNEPARSRLLHSLKFYFGDKFVNKMENRIKVVTRRYGSSVLVLVYPNVI